jgi:hypothetical protein
MHFLAFDTNIYREFGISFRKNIDFSYLSKFLEKGPHELIMFDVVYLELLDYFQNEYIGKLIKDYENIFRRFESNEYLDNIELPNLLNIEQKALNKYKKALENSCRRIVNCEFIDSRILINFLIYNKRDSKKDNTRDFIIWLELIELAEQYPDDRIIYISRDKIFFENVFFQNLIKEKSVNNIEVIESVANYLSDYGLQIDFLNEQIVLNSIENDKILEEIKKDISCFPSYVSEYYADGSNEPPRNLSIEILDVQVNDYYTYSEDKSKTIIVSSLIVKIKAVYESESRVPLKEYEKTFYKDFYYPEKKHRIDSSNRPIYENNILFIFEGELEMNSKSIINQHFIDFIPDWNVKKE